MTPPTHISSIYYSEKDEVKEWLRLLLPPSGTALLLLKLHPLRVLYPTHPRAAELLPVLCFPPPKPSHFPLSLPSQPCTLELHPGSAALQEESLGSEAEEGRVTEGNSSDQPQSPEDKDEGPAEEVGLRAGGKVEAVPLPTPEGPFGPRFPTWISYISVTRGFQVLCGKENCQILCVWE